jgi:hypothetical protein
MCLWGRWGDSDAAPEAWFPGGGLWAEAVTGVMALRWCCGLGVTWGAGLAVAPEALDDDHARAATRAWRATICEACGHVRIVVFRGRIDRWQGVQR